MRSGAASWVANEAQSGSRPPSITREPGYAVAAMLAMASRIEYASAAVARTPSSVAAAAAPQRARGGRCASHCAATIATPTHAIDTWYGG
jgi:hypothetical protein